MLTLEQFRTIVSRSTRIPIEKIQKDSLLGSDLGLSSLDIVEITFEIEQVTGVMVELSDLANQAKDLKSGYDQLSVSQFLDLLNKNE